MGGISHPLFFGGILTFLLYICIFAIGWFSHTLFLHIFSLGSSVILLKRVLLETFLFATAIIENVYDAQALKRLELERSGHNEKQLELQKRVDNKEVNGYKRRIVKTIKSNFPQAFSNMVEFDDWEGLVNNLKQQIK